MNYTADPNNRNSKGEWQPRPVEVAPIYKWPPNLVEIIKYFFGIPGFLFPWNILFISISIFTWFFLTPNFDNLKNFETGWIMQVFFRNVALLTGFIRYSCFRNSTLFTKIMVSGTMPFSQVL